MRENGLGNGRIQNNNHHHHHLNELNQLSVLLLLRFFTEFRLPVRLGARFCCDQSLFVSLTSSNIGRKSRNASKFS